MFEAAELVADLADVDGSAAVALVLQDNEEHDGQGNEAPSQGGTTESGGSGSRSG